MTERKFSEAKYATLEQTLNLMAQAFFEKAKESLFMGLSDISELPDDDYYALIDGLGAAVVVYNKRHLAKAKNTEMILEETSFEEPLELPEPTPFDVQEILKIAQDIMLKKPDENGHP